MGIKPPTETSEIGSEKGRIYTEPVTEPSSRRVPARPTISVVLPEERTPPPTNRVSPLALILIVTVVLGTVIAAAFILESSGARHGPSAIAGPVDHVVAIHTALSGSSTLFVRHSSGRMAQIDITRDTTVTSSDGSVIASRDIRPADAVTIQGNAVRDISQTRTTISGIVASPPDFDPNVMTVQIDPSHSVVVSMTQATRLTGTSAGTTSHSMLVQAMSVRLTGILDRQLNEMTRTYLVESSSAR